MHRGPSAKWLLLLLAFNACAGATPGAREDAAALSWAAAREESSCVVPSYDEARCALWRCRDLMEVDSVAITRTRSGAVALRPPWVGNPQRWRGHPLAVPTYADPIFEIPWHNWKRGEPSVQPRHPLGCMLPPEPLEKHHIFPQQQQLARWFKLKGIDIHAFTLFLPRSVHQRIHSGGPAGGQWNAAWRRFQQSHEDATAEEVWRFAFELMFLFRLNGPLTSYYCQG